MQTRPSLTLRKPASPSPEAIAAFVDKSEPTPQPQPEKPPVHLRAVPTEPEIESPAPTIVALPTAEIPPAATPAKPRKPRPAAEEINRNDAPSFRRASRAIAERRTKPSRRRTTVYLDLDVANQLSVALMERDQELSDAVNSAIKTWLRSIK